MMILQPTHAAHTRKHKGTLKISDIRDESHVGWTHSVQQVNLLPQLPDEVVLVLVGFQQPVVLLALSGQLLKTTQTNTHTHTHMKSKLTLLLMIFVLTSRSEK